MHGADDHRTGVVAECFKRSVRLYGMINMADRLGETVRTQPFDLVKRKFGPGRNHEIVVGNFSPVAQPHAFLIWFDPFSLPHEQLDVPLLHRLCQIYKDILALAPANQDPRVGGHELIKCSFVNDRDLIFRPDGLTDFVGRDNSAQTRPQNYNLRHVGLSRSELENLLYFRRL